MTEGIKERARLRDELRHTNEAQDDASRRAASLQQRFNAITRENGESDQFYRRKARGHASEQDIAEFEAMRAEVALDLAGATREAEGALSARRTIEVELGLVYANHLDEFVAEAEAFTQAAVERLMELRDVYERAADAWAEAESIWRPLRHALRDEIGRSARADGMDYPDAYLAELARVPVSPLAAVAKVFDSGVVPRPPGLSPTGDAGIAAGDEVISVDLRTSAAS